MKLTLYHGSPEIVQRPEYGKGKEYNDYGQGFYMTENRGIAGEWAVSAGTSGFVNEYTIETDDLNVLDLGSEEYNILHWLALLIDNRRFRMSTPLMAEAKNWLLDNYLTDLGFYDAVKGYRADDSYFAFARAFLNNSITLEQLSLAMKLGKPGEQFVLKSRFAFDVLEYRGYEIVNNAEYYPKRKARDEQARKAYQEMLEGNKDGLYIRDLMRGGAGNESL